MQSSLQAAEGRNSSASTKMDALKLFLQIARELKVLDNKRYLRLGGPLTEVGKMLNGWQKQLQLPTDPTKAKLRFADGQETVARAPDVGDPVEVQLTVAGRKPWSSISYSTSA